MTEINKKMLQLTLDDICDGPRMEWTQEHYGNGKTTESEQLPETHPVNATFKYNWRNAKKACEFFESHLWYCPTCQFKLPNQTLCNVCKCNKCRSRPMIKCDELYKLQEHIECVINGTYSTKWKRTQKQTDNEKCCEEYCSKFFKTLNVFK